VKTPIKPGVDEVGPLQTHFPLELGVELAGQQ